MNYITDNMEKMAITRKGLRIVLAGVIVMLAGYVLMMGGGSKDPQVFNYAMFNFTRTVASPIVIIAGVVVIILGIMHKDPKQEEE